VALAMGVLHWAQQRALIVFMVVVVVVVVVVGVGILPLPSDIVLE